MSPVFRITIGLTENNFRYAFIIHTVHVQHQGSSVIVLKLMQNDKTVVELKPILKKIPKGENKKKKKVTYDGQGLS